MRPVPDLAYVVCPSYHGATLLAMLLSRHPDVLHLGDTIPSRRIAQACACGMLSDDCPFWQELQREVDLSRFEERDRWLPHLPRFCRWHRVDWILAMAAVGTNRLVASPFDARLSQEAAEYRQAYAAFVSHAAAAAGATVFVDGMKSVSRALYLMSGWQRPARVIHLFRDPRGVAWSMMSRGHGEARDVARSWRYHHEFATVALRWLGSGPVLKLRYEDLAASPDTTVAGVMRYLGVTPAPARVRPQDEIHVIGNRMVKSFDGSVRLDEGWREGLSPEVARDVIRLSGPLAERMGYAEITG